MAQSDRSFTADVTVYSLGATSYLATLKNARVRRTVQEKNNPAAKDAYDFVFAGRFGWEVTASNCVEGTAVMLALVGTAVAVSIKETTAGLTYAGTGLVTEGDHDFAEDGAQTESITIKARGVLTHT